MISKVPWKVFTSRGKVWSMTVVTTVQCCSPLNLQSSEYLVLSWALHYFVLFCFTLLYVTCTLYFYLVQSFRISVPSVVLHVFSSNFSIIKLDISNVHCLKRVPSSHLFIIPDIKLELLIIQRFELLGVNCNYMFHKLCSTLKWKLRTWLIWHGHLMEGFFVSGTPC